MQPNKHGAFSTAKTGEDAPVSICYPQNDGKQCRKQLPAANAPAMNSASSHSHIADARSGKDIKGMTTIPFIWYNRGILEGEVLCNEAAYR